MKGFYFGWIMDIDWYFQIQSKYEVIFGAGHQSATVPFGNMSSESANSFVTQEPERTGNWP